MFQNIADNTMQNENLKSNSRIWLILKELFKPQNVVAYVLTFLVSMININGAYIPLGLAMVAAALRKYSSGYCYLYLQFNRDRRCIWFK